MLCGLHESSEVLGERLGRAAAHETSVDRLGRDGAETVTKEGRAVIDVKSWNRSFQREKMEQSTNLQIA